MLKAALLTIFTTLLITSGQVLWKIGLQKAGGFYLPEQNILENVIRIIFNAWVFSGFVVYAAATGFFMWLISKFEISMVIPITSVSFIYSLLAGYFIFHEQISPVRIMGVLLIIVGVILIVRS
ncbi:MAG TPA: EamA family transporter [Bacteroidales bacterium]|nr:EamA family transporter [Bacteroidales bacterium]HPR57009.1 EamA family transporter [Bacteroidales bacterium]